LNKYHNKKTTIDGIVFASKREANRYLELKLLELVKEISKLELQVPYVLSVNGEKICRYIADFEYMDKRGNVITEDVKGVKTAVYQLKKKLMKAIYGIDILEI